MMRTICVCRAEVTAETEESLFEALRNHCDEVHAELGITDDQVRGNLAMMAKMTPWDGQPKSLARPIEVHPLTPDRQEDFLSYFDHDAFTDNPGWASCYCFYYRFDGGQERWNQRTAEENRSAQADAIAIGEASGFLAYADGAVVGWCHAAPRGDLPLLDTGATNEGNDRVAAIVCFNVKPAHRGQGVAKSLLTAACEGMAIRGFNVLEAYPLENPKDSGQAYHGALSMYLGSGFQEVGKQGHYVVVRKRV